MVGVAVTPTEPERGERLGPEVLSQLSRLSQLAEVDPRPRVRSLPGVPSLRSASLAAALVVASAALIVAYSALAPGPAERHAVPERSATSLPGVPATRGEPLPAFVWVPARGATGYEFRLLRGGAPVYTARTTSARLTLPRRWIADGRERRLEPGTYLWAVRPLFGARRGAILVSAKLTVGG
jgi:hypothetical protein